uniref:Mitochondrial acidic protein MAM33 n=2 Tax=Rhizophora mucronata TaxID=61149 RepID=A0A2P2IX25_RHIMU
MWRRVLKEVAVVPRGMVASYRRSSSSRSGSNASSIVDSMLLRSLKEHYLEVAKMNPPPKVSPPSAFTIVKGALEGNGPVLTRTFGNEEISISVMRMANVVPGGGDEEDDINQLFLHVDVSKPGQEKSLQFLCGLYPDALGIHSVSMRPKMDFSNFQDSLSTYNGPNFEELDESMRDALHNFIDDRGVNESLFIFLQAWLYVKGHRSLLRWFKTVGTFINENKSVENA